MALLTKAPRKEIARAAAPQRDPLAEAARIAADATEEANAHAAERAGLLGRMAAVERRAAALQAESEELTAEHDRLAQRVADARALSDLGIGPADVQAEVERLAALDKRLTELAGERSGVEQALADLRAREADLTAREQDARRRAEDAPLAAQRAERERLVRRAQRARVRWLMAVRDLGAANARYGWPRPPQQGEKPAGPIVGIDKAADNLLAGDAQVDNLLWRQGAYMHYDMSWLDRFVEQFDVDGE